MNEGPPSPDAQDLARVAEVLGVEEFRVFELAYQRWHGRAPEEREIESAFGRFLANAGLPPWVRHFDREVLRRADSGQLDPAAFGLPPKSPPSPMIRGFDKAERIIFALLWVAAIIIVVVSLG